MPPSRGIRQTEQQDLLLKRISERIADGYRKGQENEGIKYILDECMQLETEARAARAENDVLRGLLAKGDKDCPYCQLPVSETSKCAKGFPGCDRMDDIMAAPITKAESENEKLKLRLTECMNHLRPSNYDYMTPEEQWQTDKELGILDW